MNIVLYFGIRDREEIRYFWGEEWIVVVGVGGGFSLRKDDSGEQRVQGVREVDVLESLVWLIEFGVVEQFYYIII